MRRKMRMSNDFPLGACGLYSKWGFGDGDSLEDYLYDLRGKHEFEMPDRDEFLRLMVDTYLVPELERQHIVCEIVTIGSIHNPVRADVVNGVDISDKHYDSSWDHPLLKDIVVWISDAQILAALEGE